MPDVFISYVEEDAGVAREIADAIEAGGFSTWFAERDGTSTVGGLPETVIDRCKVIVVLISPHSLGTHSMTNEIIRGHERAKPFIPVLISKSHLEIASRQPEWREAMGGATSISVPAEGVREILPRLVEGVAALTAPAPRRPLRTRVKALPAWLKIAVLVFVVMGIAGGGTALVSSRDGDQGDAGGTQRAISRSTSGFSPGSLADSATTPLQTSDGALRITDARLATEVCSHQFNSPCDTAQGYDRLVVFNVSDWEGRDVSFSDDFTRQADLAYVVFGDRRAVFRSATQEDNRSGEIRLVYGSLPMSAGSGEVRLVWPGSPTLILHVSQG